MAVNINVSTINNITEYPNTFKRQGAFPLEQFEVFNSEAAASTYAQSNPVAYVGQKIVIVETAEDGSVTVKQRYIADTDGTLLPLGGAVGDDKSISISSSDGIARLFGFDEATSGQQPRISTDGKLEWYTPDTSTGPGLADTVAGHTQDIANLQSGKADKATNLAGYGITDAYTKTETGEAIEAAIAAKGHAKFVVTDTDPTSEGFEAADNVLYLFKNTTTGYYDIYAKVTVTEGETQTSSVVRLDDTSVNFEGYATEAYVTDAIKNKVDKELKTGSETEYKVLSDNNYDNAEKAKVASAIQTVKVNGVTVSSDTAASIVIKKNGTQIATTNGEIDIEVPDAPEALTIGEIDTAIASATA